MAQNTDSVSGVITLSAGADPRTGPVVVINSVGLGLAFLMPLHSWPHKHPIEGAVCTVYTHCSFSERQGEVWYAFAVQEERALFRAMLNAEGVGPATALKILAKSKYTIMLQLIAAGDRTTFKKLPGVGAKTGDKLIAILFDKAPLQPDIPVPIDEDALLDEDTWKALVGLGWPVKNAKDATKIAMKTKPDGSTEDWVKLALKQPR